MKQKTPQEKKALSYARDSRNNYGENDKSSRKNIPLRKAKVNRGYRRKVNQSLHEINNEIDLEKAELAESATRNIKREGWKKYAENLWENSSKGNLSAEKIMLETVKRLVKKLKNL